MRRTLTIVSALALTMSLLVLPASAIGEKTVDWVGNGADSVVACEEGQEPYLHWILTPGGNYTISDGVLYDSEGTELAEQEGMPSAAAHFYTYDEIPYDPETGMPDLSAYEGVYATAIFTAGRNAQTFNPILTISDGCYDAPLIVEGQIDVVKTVDTSFAREHFWSIDKSVDPESITLSADNLSEEATWYVDVTYDGYEDQDIMVSGEIEISWSGNVPAEITDVTDVVKQGEDLTPGTVDCGEDVSFPVTLDEDNPQLVCTYEVELDSIVDGENIATVTGEFIEPDEPFVVPSGFEWEIEEVATNDDGTTPVVVEFGDPDPDKDALVTVTDTNAGFALKYDPMAEGVVLDAYDYVEGDVESFFYSETFEFCDYEEECEGETIVNTARVIGDNEVVLDYATATLVINVVCEFDGCTPGFWKNDTPANAPAWALLAELGITRDTLMPVSGLTYQQALDSPGGSLNQLNFHTAAALLNAAHPDVNYTYTTQQIIDMYNEAISPEGRTIEEIKDLLDAANNEGCPLGADPDNRTQ
jgi:hypothetical protein